MKMPGVYDYTVKDRKGENGAVKIILRHRNRFRKGKFRF